MNNTNKGNLSKIEDSQFVIDLENQENDLILSRMVLSIIVLSPIYILFYVYVESKVGLASLILFSYILVPAAKVLQNKGKRSLAAAFFLLSCCMFLVLTDIVVGSHAHVEYFCFPLMFVIVLFNLRKLWLLILGVLAPFLAGSLIKSELLPSLPSQLLPSLSSLKVLDNINFFSSSILVFTLLSLSIQSANRRRARQVDALNTARQELEISLKEKEKNELENSILQAQFEEAQRAAKIGSWSYEILGRKMIFSNQMFHLFNIKSRNNNYSAKSFFAYIHLEDRIICGQVGSKCSADGEPFKVRFRTSFTDKIIWVESIGRGKMGTDGKVISIFGTCQDITERVEFESELNSERSKGLHVAKLASLGEMSAGIAHEINNPLTIITTNIALLSKVRDNPEKFAVKLESLSRSAGRISKIINGLKKFSRTPTEDMVRKSESLAELIRESMVLTEVKANRHSTPIEIDIRSNAKIYCDGVEIEQVLINLVNNAIDAVKPLAEKWVKIILFEEGPELVLQIKDSGKGIPVEVAEKVFAPFFTTKPVGSGTGLGLSISKGIIEHHHGTLTVNPNDKNTCFEIRFKKIKST